MKSTFSASLQHSRVCLRGRNWIRCCALDRIELIIYAVADNLCRYVSNASQTFVAVSALTLFLSRFNRNILWFAQVYTHRKVSQYFADCFSKVSVVRVRFGEFFMRLFRRAVVWWSWSIKYGKCSIRHYSDKFSVILRLLMRWRVTSPGALPPPCCHIHI